MTRKLLLEVPEDVYASLLERAHEEGQSPEVLAAQRLVEAFRVGNDDPLAKWIGALDTDIIGWADDHDHYLGEAVRASMHDVQPENKSDG
jgi:hypothetical protein